MFQGSDGLNDPPNPSGYGHRSTGSSNYYSGFMPTHFADDTITAIAPASGSGGFTTVVLQMLSNSTLSGSLEFSIGPQWTQQKLLSGTVGEVSTAYWVEYTAPSGDLPFSIHFTSAASSVALDAVLVDTFWSPTGPVINARMVVPEPACVVLAFVAAACAGRMRRRVAVAS